MSRRENSASRTSHTILQATVDHDIPALKDAILRLLQAPDEDCGLEAIRADSSFLSAVRHSAYRL